MSRQIVQFFSKMLKDFQVFFGIYNSYWRPRKHIFWAFDKLEKVTYFYVAHIDVMWKQFFLKNKQLKKLMIPSCFLNAAYPNWLDVIRSFPNLIELNGEWFFAPNEGITVLLAKKNQLQKHTINLATADVCDILSGISHPEWIASDDDQCKIQKSVTFVRKQNRNKLIG